MKQFILTFCRVTTSLMLLLILHSNGYAQQPTITPGKHLDTVTDFYGHKYSLGEIAINDTVRAGSTGTFEAMIPAGCASGYFQLWLEPGCGFEGTDATSVARLNVLCRVFQDLSSFIASPLTTTGGRVNIWVRKMGSVAGGPFIGVATSFFITPVSSTVSGIADNTIWITLNSGTDAYTNVATPLIPTGGAVSGSSPFFHGLLAFDTSVDWHTDLTTAPGISEMDLYTVAMHEAMHALGFMTLINFNGTSRLGTDRIYYDRYDRFLRTGGGADLITPFGGCTSMYDWQFNPLVSPWVLSPVGVGGCPAGFLTGTPTDSTTCGTAIEYVDGIITNQPVYTPPCYEHGSSLSHFEDECLVPGSFILSPPASDNHYFAMSNAIPPGPYSPTTNPGAMKRFPRPEERQVLCDIGYRVDTLYGDSANLNFHHYEEGICPADPVVGINDGILPGGAYAFMTTGTTPVDINAGTSGGSLLDNDFNADSITCLEVIFGAGTFSATTGGGGTTISYTPGAGTFGVQLIRYVPVDSVTGEEGNITYVYVYVGDTNCNATACDLVPNGGFENVATGLSYGLLSGNMRCWDDYSISPDIFERSTAVPAIQAIPNAVLFTPPSDVHFPGTSLALPNDHFIGFQCYWSTSVIPIAVGPLEAAQTGLSVPLMPGQTYFISCWAKLANHWSYPAPAVPIPIQFAVDAGVSPLPPFPISTGLPGTVTPIWDFNLTKPDDNWHYFSDTFTYTGPVGNTLIVTPAPWLNPVAGFPSFYVHYPVIDDVSIRTAATLSTFDLPDTICVLDTAFDLTALVTVPGGVFSWPEDSAGTTLVSHDNWFDPLPSFPTSVGFDGLSRVTICYDYLDALGCQQRICREVLIVPVPAPITGDSILCAGSSVSLSDTTAIGSWLSSDTSVATIISSTGVLTGVSAGTVLISYGSPDFCYATYMVTVDATPDAITGSDTMCAGGDTLTFSDATTGGTWSSSPDSVATIDPGSGLLTTGVSGTVTVTYTLSTGCYVTTTVVVSVGPYMPAIVGPDSVCIGALIVLSDAYPGGTWSSGNTTIATVDPLSGVVTGIGVGTVVISYTSTDECGTTSVTKIVKVIGLPVVAPITGILGVCSGSTTTLYNATPGGVWSGGSPLIATINPFTQVVTGIATGITTFTYSVTNVCGITRVRANVRVNMPPYITTNFLVACQSLTGTGEYPSTVIISDASVCIKVCENTVVRYYANGVAGSAFTWTVTGGTVVTDYGDSIDVSWPVAGSIGSIKLTSAFSHCVDQATACIQVIEKPTANFSASATHICRGDNVIFTNLSTAGTSSPIMYRYWYFGDGSASSVEHPTHTYTATGTYTVILVVRNSCNCSDTFTVSIEVAEEPGPVIRCPSVVCEDEFASYTTDNVDPCSYYWSVVGGTIVYGAGTDSITVKWDAVGPEGFGYVRLAESCGDCQDTTTIKVPVILQNPTIEGLTTICAGKEYEYRLPLWAGTEYRWGVLGDSAAVVFRRNDYKVVVKFDSVGTYKIHGWYQNRIKLCGGNVFLNIQVVAPTSILGSTILCEGETDSYTLAGGLSGDWTLTDLSGSVVSTSTASASITPIFPSAGDYALSVTGGFCADPIIISVFAGPAAIDSITGTDTVCPGRVYAYKAWNDIVGTIYQWEAIGGTVTPASGSPVVTAAWASGVAGKMLIAKHVSIFAPYCPGIADTMFIQEEIIDPDVTGEVVPCANTFFNYTANYTRGEVYNWAIYPNTAGSVTVGDHTPDITILWNNVPSITTAAIVAKIAKCDTLVTDTLWVNVQPAPVMTITPSYDTVCPGDALMFVATAGAGGYAWNFGDGSPIVIGTDTVYHAFPPNTSIDNMIYTVRVTPLPGTAAMCPPAGIGTVDIVVVPGPVAYVTGVTYTLCGDSSSLTLFGVVTSNVGVLSYQWYRNGVAMTGDTTTSLLVTDTGYYSITVMSDNYCWATATPVHVEFRCPDGSAGCATITATTSVTCNTINLFGATPAGAYNWNWSITGVAYISSATGSVTINIPGIYESYYSVNFSDTCAPYIRITDTIGVVPQFRYEVQCASGGMDSIFLADYTTFLPFFGIDSVRWSDGTGYIGTGLNLRVARTAPGSYNFTATVYGTRPGGTFICPVTHTINLPDPPVASFSAAPHPLCEGVPMTFTPVTSPAIFMYSWDFGDTSASLLQNPERVYQWEAPTDPRTLYASLSVTDSIGCTDNDTQTISIFKNRLEGNLGPNRLVCANATPIALMYLPAPGSPFPFSYLWSTGATTPAIGVSESGAYWVTVTDAIQCQATRPTPTTLKVKVVNTPVPKITGKKHYCYPGAVVQLSGYAGTGVTYRWVKDGIPMADTTFYISDGSAGPGLHIYRLIISVRDTMGADTATCDVSVIDSIYINWAPASPLIYGPDLISCNPYMLRFTATSTSSGTFNWQDGQDGAVLETPTGGPYKVTFTDLNGCKSSRVTSAPYSPESFAPYFPSGCYDICQQQLPITLYGPTDNYFSYWAWLKNTSVLSSGAGFMPSYTITGSGAYQWDLSNGFCSYTTDPMDVTETDCDICPQLEFSAVLTCDTTDPKSYSIRIIFNNPYTSSYTLGTDIGPITPFSGIIPPGTDTMSLSFTTMYYSPLPDSVTVQLLLRFEDGTRCFHKERIALPDCHWESERHGYPVDTVKDNHGQLAQEIIISNAMLVFPNPASNSVSVSYSYGTQAYKARSLSVYDALGRRMEYKIPENESGTWNIDVTNWAAGMYLVRMEADGMSLQTQRVIVNNY